MRPTFDRRLWILLFILLIQCITITRQQNIKQQKSNLSHQQFSRYKPAESSSQWSTATAQKASRAFDGHLIEKSSPHANTDDNKYMIREDYQDQQQEQEQQQQQQHEYYKHETFRNVNSDKCAKNCLAQAHAQAHSVSKSSLSPSASSSTTTSHASTSHSVPFHTKNSAQLRQTQKHDLINTKLSFSKTTTKSNNNNNKPSQLPLWADHDRNAHAQSEIKYSPARSRITKRNKEQEHHQRVHVAHRNQHKELKVHRDEEEEAFKAHVTTTITTAESNRRLRAQRAIENYRLRERRATAAAAAAAAADHTIALNNIELTNESSSSNEETSLNNMSKNQKSKATEKKTESKADEEEEEDEEKQTPLKTTIEHGYPSSSSSISQEEDYGYLAATPSEIPHEDGELSTLIYYNESSANMSLGSSNTATAAVNIDELDAFAQLSYVGNGDIVIIPKQKRARSTVTIPAEVLNKPKEPIIIIDDVEEFDSGTSRHDVVTTDDKNEDYSHDAPMEPRVLPLRPVPPNPYDEEEMSVVYAEQHSEIRLMCEVDLDIAGSMWYKNGQVVHAMDRTSRATDYRFIKEANGALTITNVMLEDDGKWQCEAENTRRYTENARPVKLVVLDRPKPPYLLIDSRRLDAGNIFVPVKENSELNLACVSEGGNPKPTLTWEVLLSPGVDRHAQKVSAEVLELEEVKNDKDKNVYKINSGAKSEARLPAVYRAHHNARILCVMEHPTLKIRQNASLLLDVQYTPSFAISRTPGFGYPLREGIEVSLKCDVDSNPPSTPRWQKDDGDTPVPQTGDGFLNFSSIRREHSGWYKCTSRHLNFQYSSIGYYLSVRYDSVDVTSEPDDQDISVAAASHNPNKGQLEVQLGGAVTLQCPQGSLGCWSHLDPVTARLRGLGHGLSTPTGQFSLKDVVYQDAGTYKCIGQSPTNKKKLEVLQTVGVSIKGAPTVVARNATPVAYPGSPLHLAVEFCANPPAHAARWLHGDRVFTPGNQYGSTVLAYGVTDLPTPYCKEARLTYVSMHERVPRTFYFIVSTPTGVAEAVFKVNFTMRYRTISNAIDEEEEELSEPEEIHFPVFGSAAASATAVNTMTECQQQLRILLLLSAWWWWLAHLWIRNGRYL